MSASEMSVETLKKSLAANGLAQYGTKEQMLHRLLTGGTEKKKPGPKPKGDVPKKKKKATSDSAALAGGDGEEAAFMAAERPRLAAQGIVDFAAQTAELKRRWACIKKSKQPPAIPAATAGLIKLPAVLDASQMAAMNLSFVTIEKSPATGATLYVYGPSGAGAKVKAEPANKKRKGVPAVASMPRDEEEEEEEEEDDDDDMTWACEVAAMRLLKKCKKETLIMLCNDFGIPTSGNKEKLAEEAAEQLHYETDDESDDDE